MGFILSGSTITQSGIDANLSGLNGIAGVVRTVSGTGATSLTTYDIGILRLVITGTVTHDPDLELLVGSAGSDLPTNADNTTLNNVMLTIAAGGVYNYGISRVKNGITTYSESTGIRSTFQSTNEYGSSWIEIKNGGTLNWNGGGIETSSVWMVRRNCAINQFAGTIIHKHPSIDNQIRIEAITQAEADKIVFRDLRVAGPNSASIRLFTLSSWAQMSFTPLNAQYQTYVSKVLFDLIIQNYANSKNTAPVDVTFNSIGDGNVYQVQYLNVEKPVTVRPNPVALDRAGLVSVKRDYKFITTDLDGTVLPSTLIYFKEKNDGNASTIGSYNLAVFSTTSQLTNSSGVLSVTPIVENVYKKEGIGTPIIRNKRYNADDTLTFNAVRYDRLVVTASKATYGTAFLTTIDVVLFPDTLISQSNPTTVAAYISGETPQKAYDLSKLWMVNNYTGQTEPSLSRTGNLITTTKNVVIDPTASNAYSENATTITLKASAFAGSITAPSVSLVNGASVADNVIITGNLVYNTNTDLVATLTKCTISGTVSNAGTGNVKLNLVNSTVTTGTRVVAQYPITITDAGNNLFSTQIWVYNGAGNIVEDTGFNSLIQSKTVYMPVGGSLRVYSQAYGYQSKITNTAATNPTLVITHIPETLVDTALDATTRNTVAGYFSSIVENSLLYVEVDTDLASYTPAEVLNAMHYFIVSNGGNFAALSLLANTVGSVQLIDGGFRVYSAFFKGRAKSNLNSTNTPSLYITLPLYIEDASGVSGNQVMVRNANGIDVHAALWSKATANISQNDMDRISDTSWNHPNRTLNGAYFE